MIDAGRIVRTLGLVALLGLGLFSPCVAQEDEAYEAYAEGDYARAHEIWSALAERGILYQNGLGVEASMERAVEWYGRAANGGDPDAQTLIGNLLVDGYWGEPDYVHAAEWYELAAESGHAEAQRRLGILYLAGRGVQENLWQAVHWLELAAAQGDSAAEVLLAGLPRAPAPEPPEPLVPEAQMASTGSSAGVGKCPGKTSAFKVNIEVDVPRPTVNRSLSSAELTRRMTGGSGIHVIGQTLFQLEMKWSTHFAGRRTDNGDCLWVESVDLTLRLPSMEVFVAKEYADPEHSCAHRAILDHESEHVRIARDTIRKYGPRFEQALTSNLVPRSHNPILVASAERGENEIEAVLQNVIYPVYNDMSRELSRKQGAIDTPAAYGKVHARCDDW